MPKKKVPAERSSFINRKEFLNKYKDPRWQRVRLQVFERDNWTCQTCDETEITLHVHHKYYEDNKDPWEYPLEALVTLCEDCHKYETENIIKYSRLLLRFMKDKFLSNEIGCFASGFSDMILLDSPERVAQAYNYALISEDMQRLILEKHKEFIKRHSGKV